MRNMAIVLAVLCLLAVYALPDKESGGPYL